MEARSRHRIPASTKSALALRRPRQSGSQFDPVVADAFLEVIGERDRVSLVKWDDSMSVGNSHIDEQHKILIDTLNQLASAEIESDRTVVAMIIDELVNYTVFHFDFEEGLMEAAGYPDLEAHRRMHRGFVNWVGDLRDWLSQHILGEDRKYRSHIAALD